MVAVLLLPIAAQVALLPFTPWDFDEVHYVRFYQGGIPLVLSGDVPRYYVARSLIPTLAGEVLRLLAIAPTPLSVSVVAAFSSVTALIVAALAWAALSTTLGLRAGFFWGLIVLFFNAAFLAFLPWYSLLVDVWYAALTMLGLLAFYQRRSLLLAVLLGVSVFVNQFVFLFLAVLFTFQLEATRTRPRSSLAIAPRVVLATVATVAWGSVAALALYGPRDRYLSIVESWRNVDLFLSPAGFAASTVLVWVAFFHLTGLVDSWVLTPWRYFRGKPLRRAVVPVLFALVALVVFSAVGRPPQPEETTSSLAFYGLAVAIFCKPLAAWLGHAVLFGPAAVLVFAFWKEFTRFVADLPLGVYIAAVSGLFLVGLDGESRHVLHLLPVAALFAGSIAETRPRWPHFRVIVAACSVGFAAVCVAAAFTVGPWPWVGPLAGLLSPTWPPERYCVFLALVGVTTWAARRRLR